MKNDKMPFAQYWKFWLKIHFEEIRQRVSRTSESSGSVDDFENSLAQCQIERGVTLHVIPLNDGMIHCAQESCHCSPTPDGAGVVIHHAQDCREALERNGHVTPHGWATVGEQNVKHDLPEKAGGNYEN